MQGSCDDFDDGYTDFTGDDCEWYDANPWSCGDWDTLDFSSMDMCCSCGGGSGGNQATDLWYVDVSWWVSLSGKVAHKKEYAMYGAGIIALLAVVGYAFHAKKKDEIKISQNESLISTPQVC